MSDSPASLYDFSFAPSDAIFSIRSAMLTKPPFPRHVQLCHELDCDGSSLTKEGVGMSTKTLPGHPLIQVSKFADVIACLEKECCAPDLEMVAPHLWVMSTQSSANISPLHKQRIKGREIMITEDPRLHLVWIHNRVFIKPIPRYLLSYDFWDFFLASGNPSSKDHIQVIAKAVLGYLRSYRYLIQHETDLIIAQQDSLRLIPSEVDWTRLCTFLSCLEDIGDMDVSGRYQYGELRLSRLNLYAPFFFRKFYFEQIYGQYSDIFERFYSSVLFIFAIVSTSLNALQVEMAVEQVTDRHWVTLWWVSRWFSTLMLAATAVVACGLFSLWLWIFVDEWVFAIRCRRVRRRERKLQK